MEAIDINFEHVAITKEQIQRFGLGHLTNPDSAVLAKLKRDSNAAAFRADNDGQIFQVELDALNALMPDDFMELLTIRKSVKKFDKLTMLYKKERQGLSDYNLDYLDDVDVNE